MPVLTPDERIGSTIGEKYEVVRLVGRGGMGVVFEGRHGWTGRPVAIKLLHPHLVADASIATRFLREARSAAALAHPHVVDVLDMGSDEDGSVFLVLELLEGESLADRLERAGRLTPAEALEVTLPIMEALAHAHTRGVVHRDLKPDNIFLARDARGRVVPKLLDFGIAKLLDGDGAATTTGAVMGTPLYMSPEQVQGATDLGPAADVWSMGVVIYELLAGTPPYQSDSAMALLGAILTTEPRDIGEAAPELPAPFAEAIRRALTKDRARRTRSMADLALELIGAAKRTGTALEHDPTWIEALRPTADVAVEAPPEGAPGDASRMPTMPLDARAGADPIAEAEPPEESRSEPSLPPPRASRAGWIVALGIGLAAVAASGWAIVSGGPPTPEAEPPVAAAPTDAPPAPIDEPLPVDEPLPLGVPVPDEIVAALAPPDAPPDAGARPAPARLRIRPARRPPPAPPADEPEERRGANDSLIIR